MNKKRKLFDELIDGVGIYAAALIMMVRQFPDTLEKLSSLTNKRVLVK